jgi:RNA polymerase sigma-70 factor (ECF subfamily)
MSHPVATHHLDDRQLVIEAVGGSRECFGALVNRHWNTAVALALSRTSDASQAEDIAQESFIRAYHHLATLRDPSRFAGWLSRIVIQQSVDHARMSKRQSARAMADVSELELTASGPGTPGLTVEQRRLIHAAVVRLPARWRTVIVLRFVGGLSTEQIAAQLEQRSGTVRVWLHRAYRRLEADLAPLAEEVRTP